MHLDENRLPVTINEDGTADKNDQLQRVAMCYLACGTKMPWGDNLFPGEISRGFEREPGIYTRYPFGPTNDVSGDQLISILAAYVGQKDWPLASRLAWAIVRRGGFAQNTHDMYSRTGVKRPDFILFRALPLIARCNPKIHALWIVACFASAYMALFEHSWLWAALALVFSDIWLILMALATLLPVWHDDKGFKMRSQDDVDDNVPVMTLFACAKSGTSLLSYLAPRLFAKLRTENKGQWLAFPNYGPVYGALRWYHRAPAGNPEIADAYIHVLKDYFGEINRPLEG